ncbi:hypothetical protein Rs2_15860 [Raphanus sativus]|nr:hypothetical protein Rs2_15860 [Raphanus sativus]
MDEVDHFSVENHEEEYDEKHLWEEDEEYDEKYIKEKDEEYDEDYNRNISYRYNQVVHHPTVNTREDEYDEDYWKEREIEYLSSEETKYPPTISSTLSSNHHIQPTTGKAPVTSRSCDQTIGNRSTYLDVHRSIRKFLPGTMDYQHTSIPSLP